MGSNLHYHYSSLVQFLMVHRVVGIDEVEYDDDDSHVTCKVDDVTGCDVTFVVRNDVAEDVFVDCDDVIACDDDVKVVCVPNDVLCEMNLSLIHI